VPTPSNDSRGPAARFLALGDGPDVLALARHGESLGNLADADARRRQAEHLDLDDRDADVELSDAGRDQATALGRYLRDLGPDRGPTIVLTSPYRRAASTAAEALRHVDVPVVTDERLRERDLGQFDGLTGTGIRKLYADEARRRKKVGKFYYQPPGGESWADVVLRVRSLLADLRQGFAGERVWMFSHQAVIMSFRYVLEGLSEADLNEIERTTALPNCSVTTYQRTDGGLRLHRFAETGHLEADDDAPVTHEPSTSEPEVSRGA
jgi:broad specificity phosphatase PhoE